MKLEWQAENLALTVTQQRNFPAAETYPTANLPNNKEMLPDVKFPLLRFVLFLLISGCLWLIVSAFQLAFSGRLLPLLISLCLWAPLAWGLWQLHPLARKVAVILLWLIVLVLPIGLINPFAAMDGGVSGTLLDVAVPVYGLVAVALFCLHILGKYKQAFSHGG
jgi:hypothetical protein